MKKVKEFREMARTVIEGDKYKDRSWVPRNEAEEEKLNEKIRQLQKEHPEIDYTQLFETERAEQVRKEQHKKAFASYKAY